MSAISQREGSPAPYSSLGEALVKARLITGMQFGEALARQHQHGGSLTYWLSKLEFLEEAKIAAFIVRQLRIPHMDIREFKFGDELFSLVPREICLRHHVLPLIRTGNTLSVAMVDPLDGAALETIGHVCPGLQVRVVACTWDHYARAVRRVFPGAKPVSPK